MAAVRSLRKDVESVAQLWEKTKTALVGNIMESNGVLADGITNVNTDLRR